MPDTLLSLVVRDFQELASVLEKAITGFARDERASVDLDALHRALDAAQCGGEATRQAFGEHLQSRTAGVEALGGQTTTR